MERRHRTAGRIDLGAAIGVAELDAAVGDAGAVEVARHPLLPIGQERGRVVAARRAHAGGRRPRPRCQHRRGVRGCPRSHGGGLAVLSYNKQYQIEMSG